MRQELGLPEGDKSTISIHAPMWGATGKYARNWRFKKFQSTHPCGVRPLRPFKRFDTVQFQSTHPCGVRLPAFALRFLLTIISIHAPMWGATNHRFSHHHPVLFQSTHPCGVRLNQIYSFPFWSNFNPRTHVGCDFSQIAISYMRLLFQSTHPCGVRQYPLA